ncbi:MAG: single-stranded-DNA-specific exonuclease RecJ [Gammaproteobacteria bacterium]|nr:single-stranded-DNA-specific exonuclease RecJ [Gammaproteobacteria bacterium]NIN60911.1 single-stranded-DNA-specific exonuclease RecJ [Gammaproteobacteria bacterium]NIO62535.1 single-stranded-DNA-specific exonuclease RecJ [Gammaproteobacteria bacterium]NIP49548.1 single-stranded-DNA-specific exonuclease RecJ [Gammaproteobacteria bacterium]NIQ10772.1 single-stranded-DNA-specific exonuclease RecJ [Gammaproteobacteria bacterium]
MQIRISRRESEASIDLPEDLHPVLRRIYASRDIRSAEDLDYSLNGLLPVDKLTDIDKATDLLCDAIQNQKRILIVGDFDADGATSTTVAIRGLTAMGARQVQYLVPNRFEYGYGLSPEIVEVAASMQPQLIITVDNGIASMEGVAKARSMNIDVLITDHHLPGKALPEANAIVNPNQPGDQFPSKSLAGVGVMFYILIALRGKLRENEWFASQGIREPNLAELLDLVALGTVADVVPLDRNNRILVAQGLARIRSDRCSAGIRALLKAANRALRNITAQDLSFSVGPRLNAAGRLDDMSLGIECLLSDDPDKARQFARQLDNLNHERRQIQAEMHDQALDDLELMEFEDKDSIPNGICLFNEQWHQGVVGILASRIKDRLHRPVIAFACDKDGYLKGSARSIHGIHIRDVLDLMANQFPDIIDRFGGHAMAAGLTIRLEKLNEFRQLFNESLDMFMKDLTPGNALLSDGELSSQDISMELAWQIRRGGPWGQGFPEPLFDGEFEILNSRIVGEKHLKMQLRNTDCHRVIEAIAFNNTDEHWPENYSRVKTAYRLDINEFAGRQHLQLVVDYIEPLTDINNNT